MDEKTLTCADCGQPFTFSGGEQQFYQERGMTEPKRCKPCRQARKAERGGGGGAAGRGPRRSGPGAGSGGRGSSGNRW